MGTHVRVLVRAIVLAALVAAGCAGGLGGASLCEGAGGAYAGGTCSQSSPSLQAAKDSCETRGGVFLAGQNICAYGLGQ